MITIRGRAVERACAVAASAHEAVGTEGEGWAGSIATRGAALLSMTWRSRSTTTAMAASSRLSRSREPGYDLSTPSLRPSADWRQSQLEVHRLLGRPRRTLRDRRRKLRRQRPRSDQARYAAY